MKKVWIRRAVVVFFLAPSLSAWQGLKAGGLKTEYLDDFAVTCKHLDQLAGDARGQIQLATGARSPLRERSLRPHRQWELPAPLLDRCEASS